MKTFLAETGWQPQASVAVARALRYAEYDYFKHLALTLLAGQLSSDTATGRDTVYTDWEGVARFTQQFLWEVTRGSCHTPSTDPTPMDPVSCPKRSYSEVGEPRMPIVAAPW